LKVRVDFAKCIGTGTCESVAGDVFEVAEDAVVRVLRWTVDAERRPAVDQAIQQCPVGALRLEE
jgi:ferredoxin